MQFSDELEALKARVAGLEGLQARSRETERQLLVSNQRLAGILSIAQDAIISIDSQQRIQMFNRGAEQIFGYTAAEVLGQPLGLLLPDRFIDSHQRHVQAFGKGPEVARMMGERREILGRRKDGSEFPAEASISKLVQPDGEMVYTVILRDITDRKEKENELQASREELRRLAAHLESVRDEESKRIAREVHDELGQSLTALKMRLFALSGEISPTDQKLQHKLQELVDVVSGTMDTVRRIATQLRPSLLDSLGLEAAIRSHVEGFQKTTGIETVLDLEKLEPEPDSQLSIALFRMVQEALTNVARHSEATRVKVELKKIQNPLPFLRLEIADDGKGFSVQKARRKSLGLIGMKERALNLGGDVSVQSQPGQGAKVIACIPLERPQ
ncbi:MAG: PAS domain S-box protein [Acidobacteriota bacterium]